MSIAKTLLNLKEKIEDKEEEQRQTEAEKKHSLSLLKKEFDVDTIKDGEFLLKELLKKAEKKESKLKKMINALEEKYDWE